MESQQLLGGNRKKVTLSEWELEKAMWAGSATPFASSFSEVGFSGKVGLTKSQGGKAWGSCGSWEAETGKRNAPLSEF